MHESMYDDDLKAFRDSFKKFIDKEIKPHHPTWEREGVVPRAIWEKAGAASGVDITIASGKAEGDDQGQIDAIENAIAAKQKGILITPMSTGVNDAIKKAREVSQACGLPALADARGWEEGSALR